MLIYRGMKRKIKRFDVNKVAKEILLKVSKIKTDRARIIAMSGDLGAGKTTLTQEISKELGIKNSVVSPTFVIMKIYKINSKNEAFKEIKNLVHIDAYRLDGSKELEKIGWKNLYKNKENLIIIEWPENVKDCLDSKTYYVYLKHVDEETRIFEY
ncbi:MAG: tRNA (adenosine(37)-N6)-threonylcarbamoyltransferase complex ATPase subunit type 1 TsaE [Candidatus Moranbacteria bacterium]|nr:tRNA (adenosine(37)-N6)-threonylcarbamoyltransferase complex ATPase subunit type 1 TsaE [Candidatus Moranbacteria bacterium]